MWGTTGSEVTRLSYDVETGKGWVTITEQGAALGGR
jgi:hypothetical protein